MTSFLISVDVDGYRWAELEPIGVQLGRGKTGRYLVSKSDRTPGNHLVRTYDPMETPALFRRFSDLEGAEHAVNRFADEHGLLGSPTSVMVTIPKEDEPNEDVVSLGESLNVWRSAIHEMNETITIWDWVCERDVSSLGRHITWNEGSEGRSVSYYSEPIADRNQPSTKGGYYLIAHAGADDKNLIASFAPGDLIAPAATLVRTRVNAQLKARAYPYLFQSNAEVRFSLGARPAGLLGALWLQFAHAIESDLRFRRCDHCGQWFRFEPRRGRYPRLYCSQAHKMASHRLAKKVESLAAEGLNRDSIAEQLGISIDRVRAIEKRQCKKNRSNKKT